MATAPGHRLGQIIGDVLEEAVKPLLADFAGQHDLYLDSKGVRLARPGLKCTWIDDLGNAHDLDFVLERAGSMTEIGLPAAFIETAWRRYTKHSRAKAQEIQGAVLPLLAKHAHLKPFIGAVVAGEWTSGALNQLRSSGFCVMHMSYGTVVGVFSQFDIDVAAGEETPDSYLQVQVDKYDALTAAQKADLATRLREAAPDEFAAFINSLRTVVLRTVVRVLVLPLYGDQLGFDSVLEAIDAIANFGGGGSATFQRFEILLDYSNGDEVRASFQEAEDALAFLKSFV